VPSGGLGLRDRDQIGAAAVAPGPDAAAERFVSVVMDVIGALVLVLDRQGRVVWFNGACERLSGWAASEVVGRVFWDEMIPADEVEAVKAGFADLRAGSFPNSYENHWLTRAGALRLIQWENACLFDDQGAVTNIIATGTDITEARRRHEAIRGIEAVGRLLADQGPVPSVLDAVLGEMQMRMGYSCVSLYLSDPPGLRLAAQRGCTAAPELLDTEAGVVGRVFRGARGELVADVRGDRDYVPGYEGVASEIAVPLLADGGALGVLDIEADRPEVLTESDLQFARTTADRLSSALRRSQVREAHLQRTRLLAALVDFSATVNAIHDTQRLAVALADAVRMVVPADAVIVTMRDRSDGKYLVKAARGLTEGAVGTVIDQTEGTLARVIRERATIFTDRIPRDKYTASLRQYMPFDAIRAMLVPLMGSDEVLGLITVGRIDTDQPFSEAEREVFALLGSHAALALRNAYLSEEVQALAIRDGLTGLYNRRHFDAVLDLAIARFTRHAPAGDLAAIMFDLDHFGDFNRRYGHLAGDTLLRAFAGILKDRLRSADIVARYGGEEFVAILEDCGLPEAARLAEEVRKRLEGATVKGPDGRSLRATVSAGCSVMHSLEPTREALLGRADVGLYMAKEAGRNRVVSA
jgi:diguanylate cyclase (GGDEF)-like protein/PAS domain S-box-containing protein